MIASKTLAKSLLRAFGLAIHRIPTSESERRGGFSYAAIYPSATFAPWLSDIEFMKAFDVLKSHSLVDIYRMYELWQLAEQTQKIGGDIVEVGVWKGGTGCLLAKRAAMLDSVTKVYLCDTFSGVVKSGENDSSYVDGEHRDTSRRAVETLAHSIGLSNVEILEGIFPEQTGSAIASSKIRLLHIDVDVYQSSKDTVDFLWNRMPSGSAVVFDDYGFVGCDGVTRHAEEFRAAKKAFLIHNLNGHAIVIKISD